MFGCMEGAEKVKAGRGPGPAPATFVFFGIHPFLTPRAEFAVGHHCE